MDMVEKVARAIAQEYSGIPNYDWTAFEGEARVAIEAMREPTEEMIRAGGLVQVGRSDGDEDYNAPLGGYEAELAYAAMIEAALKPLPPDRR